MSIQGNTKAIRPLTEDEIKLRPVTYICLTAFFVVDLFGIFCFHAWLAGGPNREMYGYGVISAVVATIGFIYLTRRLSATDRERSLKARQAGGSS